LKYPSLEKFESVGSVSKGCGKKKRPFARSLKKELCAKGLDP
jgi:hypothetical protein